jgi:hypothetical protein
MLSAYNIYGQLQWQTTDHVFNQPPLNLCADQSRDLLFIGGSFRFYGQSQYSGIAQWNGNSMQSLGCGLGCASNFFCSGVRNLFMYKEQLYALYFDDSIGCQDMKHFSKWDGHDWINLNQSYYNNGSETSLYSAGLVDSTIFVSGPFDSINNFNTTALASFDGQNWDVPYTCPLFTNDYLLIYPLITYNGITYAQNNLRDTLGHMQYFSRWMNNCWEKVPGGFSQINHDIRKMIVYHGKLYIAGSFNKIFDPQSPGFSIAAYDGTTWDDLHGGIRYKNDTVHPALIDDMMVYNDELYVVGDFDVAGQLPVKNIAKWDGQKWCGFSNNINREVTCIAAYHDSIFIGGTFRMIDNDSIQFFAKAFINQASDTCELFNAVEFYEKEPFAIAENPINGKISVKANEQIKFISFHSMLGYAILEKELNNSEFTMDGSNLPQGVYIINVTVGKNRYCKKIIISH